MAREIKFRGRIRQGKWIVGEIISLNNHKYIAPEDGDWFDFIPWVPNNVFHAPDSDEYEVDKETIGQFTGLRDKNGKEIYEGDIFHLGSKSILYQVVWHDTGLIGKQIHASCYAGLEHWKEKILVIGNIHDNPELLNVEK